jgi:hypothetical protein
MWFLAPVAWPIAKVLDGALGANEAHTYKKAELKSFLQLHASSVKGEGLHTSSAWDTSSSGSEAALRDDELSILQGVLELSAKSVEGIMTPMEVRFVCAFCQVWADWLADFYLSLKDVVTLSADDILDDRLVESMWVVPLVVCIYRIYHVQPPQRVLALPRPRGGRPRLLHWNIVDQEGWLIIVRRNLGCLLRLYLIAGPIRPLPRASRVKFSTIDPSRGESEHQLFPGAGLFVCSNLFIHFLHVLRDVVLILMIVRFVHAARRAVRTCCSSLGRPASLAEQLGLSHSKVRLHVLRIVSECDWLYIYGRYHRGG